MKPIVLLYVYCLFIIKKVFHKNFSGLGKIQKLLRKNYIFNFKGKKLYYSRKIAGGYGYLLIGKPNEPETHCLFKRVVPLLNTANFVDVGASLGEMVIGISIYPNIKRIIAFEPQKECVEVLRKLTDLNDIPIEIHDNIVSDVESEIPIFYNSKGSTSYGIYGECSDTTSINIKSVKLDSVLPEYLENTIVLIDIEGAEPLAIKGGLNFIRKNKPLIIFEYNAISKKYYKLEDIQSLIGHDYEIYRLKHDGSLDKDFSNSWNCVAIPLKSQFQKILFE